MSRILLFLLLISTFACNSEQNDNDDPGWEQETPTNKITVMTYNVKYCSAYNSTIPNVDSIARVISQANPDIVFLQELDRNTTRSGKVDQLAVLSEKTNLPYTTYGKAIDYQGGESGLGILSRYQLSDPQVFHLPRVEIPDTYVSYRILVAATILVADKKVTIANTHLELTQQNRDLQVPEINKVLLALNNPVILGGDFNATPDNNTMQTFFSYGFEKTCLQGCNTISSYIPAREIDYILYRPESKFNIISHDVISTMASDHMPIVSVIEVN